MILFQYRTDTPTDRILRHHQVARWIIYPCAFFSLAVFSSLAHGLLFRFDRVTLIVLIIALGATILLILPALVCLPWIRDAENELRQRGVPIPGGMRIETGILRTTVRMVGWAIAIVAGPVLVRKLIALCARF